MSLADALETSLASIDLADVDAAVVTLARLYAIDIDGGESLLDLGPKLLACLDHLKLTPKARAAMTKEVTGGQTAASPLDELRAKRRSRAH